MSRVREGCKIKQLESNIRVLNCSERAPQHTHPLTFQTEAQEAVNSFPPQLETWVAEVKNRQGIPRFGCMKNHGRWPLVMETDSQAGLQVATTARAHIARAQGQRLGQWFCVKEPQGSQESTPSQMIRKQFRGIARVGLDHKDSMVQAAGKLYVNHTPSFETVG